MKEDKTFFEKLYEAGEEGFARFTKDLLSQPKFSEAVGRALRNAAATKGAVDRNVEALLGMFNVPSKADYNKLLAKVETVQGTLVNLNIKLDRLLATLATQEKFVKPARRKRKRPKVTAAPVRRPHSERAKVTS
jgi:hypothetical protein